MAEIYCIDSGDGDFKVWDKSWYKECCYTLCICLYTLILYADGLATCLYV